MSERFRWVGTVRKVRAGDGHVVGEVRDKVALVIQDPDAGECVGYFDRGRRPRVGARIGACGHFVVVDVPPAAMTRSSESSSPAAGRSCNTSST